MKRSELKRLVIQYKEIRMKFSESNDIKLKEQLEDRHSETDMTMKLDFKEIT